jgi:predicted nucleotide-binding protein
VPSAAAVPDAPATPAAPAAAPEPLSSGLFVAHGVSSPASESVRRFLRDLGIHLLALPATPQGNKSLVGTLEQGPGASFAVILLNPEDAAALATPGACRPAITFQLGYFVGRLGLPRVCVLCEGGSDVFHDEHGILCLPLDPANGWHLQLARHLKRAGIEVDLNKLC